MKRPIHGSSPSILAIVLVGIFLLATVIASAQVSISAGLGMSSMGDIVNVKLQAEARNKAGISATLLAHMDNENPAYIPIEVFKPIRIDKTFRIVPHAGWAYKIKSMDDTDKNNGCVAYGLDLDLGMSQKSTVTFGFTMMYDKYKEKIYQYNDRYEFEKMFTLTRVERPLFFSITYRYSFGKEVDDCR